ncbi:hypothetical protein LTR70_007160 [Exophiala xenobiotica]|uniref:SRP9 domain-containing protein n=1 Tax=Lithohypha guttulata TaxID=1690604 RepID=A0ABR0KFD5_9EURO|nr:hypothetical protein LTR24_003247 [Lithohypha guttulata]KAK5314445.1 hypothetical protein LTR70_007160 [Exophiala xenobiotica]
MPYFSDLNTYLHQSSLLIQAYPQTTRITTKYSQPRKVKSSKGTSTETEATSADAPNGTISKPKKEPSATLTLKTYHPDSGICLKYKTDKAAEVGRLMTGLGRLAKGEIIDMATGDGGETTTGAGVEIGSGQALVGTDTMEVDGGGAAGAKTAAQMTQGGQQQQSGGGGKKKKKGKK